jgi:CBS domain-containing protein
LKVKDVMQQDPVTITRDLTLRETADIFVTEMVEALPVVNETGDILGIVTPADLIKLFIPDYLELVDTLSFAEEFGGLEPDAFFGAEGRLFLVEDIMRKDVPIISPEASLFKAVVTMDRQNAHVLMVVEEGKLMGTITLNRICCAFFSRKCASS